MMPGLLISSIPQGKLIRREGACLQLFQAIGNFEPTFIDAHQASNMIWKVRSHKSRIKIPSFLEDIIASSNKVLKDFESDIAVGI
jgi:hypothetical protein